VTAPARTLDPRAAIAARLRRQARSEARWSSATLLAGLAILAVIVGTSLVAPLLGFDDPTDQDLANALLPPSLQHPFGTDALGRDVFTRVNYGTRIDLVFGVVTTYIPLAIGVLVGALAGYFGGWSDAVLMRLADFVIAFPLMVLVLAVVAVMGAGITAAYVGILVVAWALYARLTRGEMLVLRESQFIMAAQGLGYSTPRIILRHALPNVIRASLVFSMADMVLNILTLAGLSYLGLGVAPPTPEWGAIVAEGQPYLRTAWWISTFAGLTIVLAGVSFSLIGDALADRLGTDLRVSA
jgi:peptide/nickel transport system permease protein